MGARSNPKDGYTSWRRQLKIHGHKYLKWLDQSGRTSLQYSTIANQLSTFLVNEISRASQVCPEAPILFWDNIPKVLQCCNDLSTFEKSFAVEAYAYVHFLERYRRTWKTLEYLTSLSVLPLGSTGVRVLDIGAGPAHSSYAIADFYAALHDWAVYAKIPELAIPPPTLSCIEQSRSMVHFFHIFSEFTRRAGPFRSITSDFKGLDLQAMRTDYRRQNGSEDYWDPDTEQIETDYDLETAYNDAEKKFRFRLLVLSNFLTLEVQVDRYEVELFNLFSDMRAGGVALILGATGGSYQTIYEKIANIARRSGLVEKNWQTDNLGELLDDNMPSDVMKMAQYNVYKKLIEMVDDKCLNKGPDWPNYWTPEPFRNNKSMFALKVFRRGR